MRTGTGGALAAANRQAEATWVAGERQATAAWEASRQQVTAAWDSGQLQLWATPRALAAGRCARASAVRCG
ncbi:hypothetical protein [Streptomyces phaeochromogenes]|uniref:hypothetical protein n=1 Tax=Streptomyces phaeochromogenes TaxID=1923 RepID=UPI00386A97E1|nr:hypothetical protein OHB08_43000 [Streptomyces phaeochromogenes]